MAQSKYQALWKGNCEECGTPITFSPDKPMVLEEHEYKCKCGVDYWIDRKTGYYKRLGTSNG